MAITFVQEAGSTSSAAATTLACSWPGATTAGNLLILGVSVAVNSLAVTLTPPAGWTLIDTAVTANNGANPITTTALYYKKNAASESGSKTFTFSQAVNASMFLSEWSGADTTAPLDVTSQNTQTATSTLVSGTTSATSQAAELAVAVISENSNFTLSTPTNGFTLQDTQKSGSSGTARISGAFLYKILAASAAQSTGVTSTGSNPAASKIATFKAASAAALVQWTSTGSAAGPQQFPLGPPDMSGAITITDTTPDAVFTPTHPGDPAGNGLRSGVDYIIQCPAVRSRRMMILGGRHVYVPQYLMRFAAATPLSQAPDGWMLGIQGGDTNGIVHFGTVHLDNNQLQCDAFKTFKSGGGLSSPAGSMPRTVQIKVCLVEKLVGQTSQVHADLFQTSGGCGDIWIEDFTGSTEFDGFMFQQELNCENQTVFFNVTAASVSGANYVYTTSAAHGYSIGDPVVVYNPSLSASAGSNFYGGWTINAVTSTTFTVQRGDDASPTALTAGSRVTKVFAGYVVGSANFNRVNVKGFANELTAGASLQSIRFGVRTAPQPNPGNPGNNPPTSDLGMPSGHVHEDRTPINVTQWAGTLSATNWYGEPDAGTVADWCEPDSSSNNYSEARPTQHAAAGGQPAYASWDNHPQVTAGTKFQQGPPPGGDYVTIQGGLPVARVADQGTSGVSIKMTTLDAPISITSASNYPNAYDRLERSVGAGSLGTADLGGTYTLTGTAADFSVTGHAAVIAVTAAAQTKRAVLSAITMRDQIVTATMQTDTTPAGSYTAFDLYLRYIDANNWYRARVALNPSGTIQVRWEMNLASVLTTLKAFVTTPLTAQTANDYTIIAQAIGATPTVLSAGVYDASSPPPLPLPFQVSASDSSSALQVASAAGIGAALNAGSTATATKVSVAQWDAWPTRWTSSGTIGIAVPDTRLQILPILPPGPSTKHRHTPR